MEDLTEQQVDQILNRDSFILDLLDSSDVLISLVDSNARFIKVNQKFADVLGYLKEELVGSNYLSFVTEDTLKQTVDVWQKLVDKKIESTGPEGFTNKYSCRNGRNAVITWYANTKSIRGYALSIAIFKGYE